MNKIKLLLADDHAIVRSGIRSLLEKEIDIEIIGETENGREAVKKTKQLCPDVVLMDISMPSLNGIEATCQITKHCPDSKVLILTMHETEEYISKIFQAGAQGYVIKKALPVELVSAIRAVHRGESFLSPQITKKVIHKYVGKTKTKIISDKFDLLTEREREILQLIVEGHTNQKISEILFISRKTVETHRTNLMKKLDIHNVVELIKSAVSKGFLPSN